MERACRAIEIGQFAYHIDDAISWRLQQHNAREPEFQFKLGDYFRTFLADESCPLHPPTDDLAKIARHRS